MIAARTGNGAGIAGTCWHATVIPLKVLSGGVGTTADAIQALDYLTNLKRLHRFNIVAVNCAWSTTAYSQALHDAVLRAAREGILIVAAAGNAGQNLDISPSYPAAFDTRIGTSTQAAASHDAVITVGAIDRFGAMPSWSGWGPTRVDLLAPGADIVTTAPPNAYTIVNGTSLAAAHVSGAIALFASGMPGATAAELRSVILSSVAPTPSAVGRVATGGRLDIAAGLQAVVVRDAAIGGISTLSSVAQNRTVAVDVSVSNNGSQTEALTVYVVDVPPSGGRAGTLSPARTITLPAGATRVESFSWNTTGATIGTHVLTARVRNLTGETKTHDNVRSTTSVVTNVVTPQVSSLSPSSMTGGTSQVVQVSGSGFATGATAGFSGGTGRQPVIASISVSSDGRTMTLLVMAGATTSLGAPWDITVANPDGRAGRKLDCFTVTP